MTVVAVAGSSCEVGPGEAQDEPARRAAARWSGCGRPGRRTGCVRQPGVGLDDDLVLRPARSRSAWRRCGAACPVVAAGGACRSRRPSPQPCALTPAYRDFVHGTAKFAPPARSAPWSVACCRAVSARSRWTASCRAARTWARVRRARLPDGLPGVPVGAAAGVLRAVADAAPRRVRGDELRPRPLRQLPRPARADHGERDDAVHPRTSSTWPRPGPLVDRAAAGSDRRRRVGLLAARDAACWARWVRTRAGRQARRSCRRAHDAPRSVDGCLRRCGRPG